MATPGDSAPNCASLLEQISTFISRFVVLPDGIAPLLAAWVLHTYVFAAAEYTPYVVVVSPTKGSGKSRLLEVLELLVLRPLPSANTTASALYRSIEEGKEPTMLLDEQDGIRDETIRKVLNAGFRRGQMVTRTAPGGKGVESFASFCPKVIASIGGIPHTVADRSIRVEMKRRLPDETVDAFLRRDADAEVAPLRIHMQAFADKNHDVVAGQRPNCPDGLDDRGRDIYEPLFAIADVAGGKWSVSIRGAAVANRPIRFGQRDDPKVELLRDIRANFGERTEGFVPSQGLTFALVGDPMLRWGEWKGGRGLTQTGLAWMLREFGIKPGVNTIVVSNESETPTLEDMMSRQRRGYFIEDFQELFLRYLDPPDTDATGPPAKHPFLEKLPKD